MNTNKKIHIELTLQELHLISMALVIQEAAVNSSAVLPQMQEILASYKKPLTEVTQRINELCYKEFLISKEETH